MTTVMTEIFFRHLGTLPELSSPNAPNPRTGFKD